MFVLLIGLACDEGSADKLADSAEAVGADSGDSGATDDSGLGDSGGGGDDGGDTGTLPIAEVDVTAEISAYVNTVAIVRWTTTVATAGRVEFGLTTAYGHVSNTTPAATEHEVLLLGMTADTEVHFRVVIDAETGEQATKDYTITTLSLPSGMPVPVVSGAVTGQWAYQVTPIQGSAPIVTILDSAGKVIWYYKPTTEGNLMKVVLTHDRKSVLLGHAGPQGDLESSKLEWISLDGGTVTTVTVPGFDHDLIELPDGTVAMIVVEDRTLDDGSIWSADRIVERAPDGTETVVFNAWDQLDPTGLGLEEFANWTHGNGIEYTVADDCYYLSMKEPGSLAKIPRETGVPEWIVNGMFNQFTFLDGAESGAMQHQFEVLGDGHLLLFDNGQPERGYSRAVELQLDETTMEAIQLWEYVRVPPVYVYAKGDVHRFADNSTQITWSTAGEMQLVDEAGGLLWQLNLPLGAATTFVHPVQSLYEDR